MLELYRNVVGKRTLHVVVTERADGDQRPDRDTTEREVSSRAAGQRLLTGHRWTMAAEEHGVGVVHADVARHPEPAGVLPPGDVLVTAQTDRALAVWAGDCAPLVLCGVDGTLVAVHAGWKGLAAGIIDVAVAELGTGRERAAAAVLGPCIHVECYEFGSADLDAVAAGVGAPLGEISSTVDGRSFLDVPAAVAAALDRRGIDLDVVGPCTSCDERWFSHRARGDDGRHAMVAWTTVA